MTTTPLSTHLDQVLRTIVDQRAQAHTLELMSHNILLVDGRQATVSITSAEVHLTTEAGTVCVTAQAFWHAFAGAEPSAAEAGLLLADSLMRLQALQQVRQVYAQIQTLDFIPLPTYRLSPFIQQALDAYDGTAETTLLLARILKQDPTTISTWAISLGKVSTPMTLLTKEAQNGHHIQNLCKISQQEERVRPEGKTSTRIQWTAEMDTQLISAFEANHAKSIKKAIAEIAKSLDLPLNAVHGRVYKLKLNEKKHASTHHNRESEASQEGD